MGEVIEYVLRVSGEQAAQSLGAVANEAQRTKAALDATSRLEILSARGGTEIERAALAYRNLAIEIRGLVDAGGDAAMATRVMERAQAELAATVARTNAAAAAQSQAIRSSAVVLDSANVSTGAYKAGLFSLGQQLMDVGAMAASGANPLTILALQGPQIATAAAQVGGFGAAVKGIAGYLVTLAPLLAGATVAVAALGTAYAVVGNATMTAESEARDHNEALVAQALAAARTTEEVDKLTKSWASYTDRSSEVQLQLAVLTGALTEAEAASDRAAQAVERLGAATLDAAAKDVGQMQTALKAALSLANDRTAPASTRQEASADAVEIQRRLRAAQEAIEATRERIDVDAQAAIRVVQLTQEQKAATEAERERAAAIRAAAEAARAAEEAWGRYFASVKRAGEIAAAMGQADRVLAASRAGTDQAAQWALYGRQLEAVARIAADAEAERLDGLDEEQARLVGLVSAMNDYANATNNATAARSGLSAAGGATEMAVGGPQAVMQGVGNAGPWGALIAAIVELIGNFKDIGDMFNDFTISFNESIGSLGQTLGDNLGRWLETGTQSAIEMIPNLIGGIAEALPDIVGGILESIPKMTGKLIESLIIDLPKVVTSLVMTLINPMFMLDMAMAFIKAIIQAIASLIGSFAGLFDAAKESNTAKSGSFWSFDTNKDGEGWWQEMTGDANGAFQSARAGSRRSGGRAGATTSVHFHAPVIGLGADGAQTLSTEMVARNYMRTPG